MPGQGQAGLGWEVPGRLPHTEPAWPGGPAHVCKTLGDPAVTARARLTEATPSETRTASGHITAEAAVASDACQWRSEVSPAGGRRGPALEKLQKVPFLRALRQDGKRQEEVAKPKTKTAAGCGRQDVQDVASVFFTRIHIPRRVEKALLNPGGRQTRGRALDCFCQLSRKSLMRCWGHKGRTVTCPLRRTTRARDPTRSSPQIPRGSQSRKTACMYTLQAPRLLLS